MVYERITSMIFDLQTLSCTAATFATLPTRCLASLAI